MSEKIAKINKVIESYFNNNTSVEIIPAKDLMLYFIKDAIFNKDVKNGKPIRDVLRELKKNNQLHLIPSTYAEQKEKNTNWYFIPANAPLPTTFYKQEQPSAKKTEAINSRLQSDETYVIDLCDKVLNLLSERQKRFSFLLGDLHKDGITRTQLPVDSFYKSLNLAIEYKESQHSIENKFFDKPDYITVSGVARGEQRKIYDERRAVVLTENGIKLIEISYSNFNCDSNGKIIRNKEEDIETVKQCLNDYIKNKE